MSGAPHSLTGKILAWIGASAAAIWVVLLPALSIAAQPATTAGRWRNISNAELSFGPPRAFGFSPDGAVWIGGQGGMHILQPDGSFRSIPLPNPEARVTAIGAAEDGLMWVATEADSGTPLGVVAIWPDGRQEWFTSLTGLADDQVRDIAVGANGEVWFATAGGVSQRTSDGGWLRYTRAAGLIDNDAYALAVNPAGEVWIGTRNGLSRRSVSDQWESFSVTEGLASPWIRDLAHDGQGNIWCATGLGVSRRTPAGEWHTFTIADGLSANAVNAIALGPSGEMWFATAQGVSHRSITGEWTIFDREAGLLDNNISAIAVDEEGRVWIASAAGINVWDSTSQAPAATEPATMAISTSPTDSIARESVPRAERTEPVATTVSQSIPPVKAPLFVEVGFYVIFFLAIVGAGVMTRHIIMLRRSRPAKGIAPDLEGVDVAWDAGLVPTTLSDEEGRELAPEVQEALAALDAYSTPKPDSIKSPTAGAGWMPSPKEIEEATTRAPGSHLSTPQDPATRSEIRRKALESWLRRATPADAEDLMREGIRMAQEHQRAEAYDIFSHVTRLVPDHVEAWMWKGGMAFHPREAVRCLQRALELDPHNRRAQEGLNWALARLAAEEEGPLPE